MFKRIFLRLARSLLQAVGYKRVLFLDGPLGQLSWFGFSYSRLKAIGLRHGLIVETWSTSVALPASRVEELSGGFDVGASHRGISLFAVAEYPIFVHLEIARHEFDAGSARHCQVAQAWMLYAKEVIDSVHARLTQNRPDAVVVMQGYFCEAAAVRALSADLGFQVFALETTFCSNRMICEPFTGISVNKNSSTVWYRHFSKRDIQAIPDARSSRQSPVGAFPKSSDHTSPSAPVLWGGLKHRILFIGQCYTDSSLLYGSPGEGSTVEIVRLLETLAKPLHASLLVKLHPKENAGNSTLQVPYKRLTYRKLLAAGFEAAGTASDFLNGKSDVYIDFANELNTNSLIEAADVVVTINSQGGLEALLQGKEVVVFGDAFYAILDAVWKVQRFSDVEPVLQSILVGRMRRNNREVVDEYVNIYLDKYCIEKSESSLMKAIANRLQRKLFVSM